MGFATFSLVQLSTFVYITMTYIKIKRIVSNHYKSMRQVIDIPKGGEEASNKLYTEKSHNRTLLIILSVFVIVWFPFMTVLIIGTVYQAAGKRPGSWLQKGFVWTAILTYVNGAVNPFIYTIRYKEIREEMGREVRRLSTYLRLPAAVGGTDA